MDLEGVCSGICKVTAMLLSQPAPAAILNFTSVPFHHPLLSVKGHQGLWRFLHVCFEACVSQSTTVCLERPGCITPPTERVPACSFSQHNDLDNTRKWACPQEPEETGIYSMKNDADKTLGASAAKMQAKHLPSDPASSPEVTKTLLS